MFVFWNFCLSVRNFSARVLIETIPELTIRIDHNFGSNYRRHLMLKPCDGPSQGPSYVTLTVTFELDHDSSIQVKLSQPYQLVYQIKCLGPLIPDVQFIVFVTGRHIDVMNDVKIIYWP